MKTCLVILIFAIGSGLIGCGSASSPGTTTVPTPDSGWTRVIFDQFQAADGADLDSLSLWTIDDSGAGSSLKINDLRANPIQGSGASPAASHGTAMTLSDVWVFLDVEVSGGDITDPVLQLIVAANSSDPAAWTLNYSCGYFGATTLEIQRAGVTKQSASSAVGFADTSTLRMSFKKEGTLLTCAISNGANTQTITWAETGSSLTGNYTGFVGGKQGQDFLFVDNYEVYEQ